MNDDLVKRLRDADTRGVAPPQNWTTEAADEIERLRHLLDGPAEFHPIVLENRDLRQQRDELLEVIDAAVMEDDGWITRANAAIAKYASTTQCKEE